MDLETATQFITDNLAPLIYPRWTFTGLFMFLYLRRVYIINSHPVVTYFVGIYLIHSLILFLTPKDDAIPDPFDNADDENYNPRNIDNDFRPYVRRLPEFDFWKMCTQIIGLAYFVTYFPFLDLPVYKPVLIVYFIFIVIVTCYKLWIHSKKYNYSFFAFGKKYMN